MKIWRQTPEKIFLESASVSFPLPKGDNLRDVLAKICQTSHGKLCFLVFTAEEESWLRKFLEDSIGTFANYSNGQGPTDFLAAVVCGESRFHNKLPIFVSYVNEDPNKPIDQGPLRLAFWINHRPQ